MLTGDITITECHLQITLKEGSQRNFMGQLVGLLAVSIISRIGTICKNGFVFTFKKIPLGCSTFRLII